MIIKLDAPNTHWLGDILQRLRSQIVVDNIDLAANLPVGVIRDADATGFRDPLKARGNIDAIAKDIVVVDDDIADVDTDPEFNPDTLRDVGVLHGHAALDLNRAAGGIDGAGKLDQHSVAGSLDDATAMRGDYWIEQRLSERLQIGKRAFLVTSHQTAVTGDIRRQDRCQSSFHALAAQGGPSIGIL